MVVPMLLGGGLSLAGNLFSQHKSNQANTKYNKFMGNMISDRRSDLDGWFKNEYYRNFLDTDMARSVLSKLQTQFGDMSKDFQGSAVKSGATAESKVAGRGELAKRYAEAINNLAGYGTERKDNIRREHTQRLGALDSLEANFRTNQHNQQLQSYANMGQNITGAAGMLASAFMPQFKTGG